MNKRFVGPAGLAFTARSAIRNRPTHAKEFGVRPVPEWSAETIAEDITRRARDNRRLKPHLASGRSNGPTPRREFDSIRESNSSADGLDAHGPGANGQPQAMRALLRPPRKDFFFNETPRRRFQLSLFNAMTDTALLAGAESFLSPHQTTNFCNKLCPVCVQRTLRFLSSYREDTATA